MQPKYWEVMLPEPLVIDASIKDEEFITGVLSNTENAPSVIVEAMQQPTKGFVLLCAEEDLKSIFEKTFDEYISTLEKMESCYMISICDQSGDMVGRGQINRLGTKLTKEKSELLYDVHMEEFHDKWIVGKKRLDRLMFQVKNVMNNVEAGKTFIS